MSTSLVQLPLSSLVPSKLNIRKTDKTAGISELAASIASKGLLENLIVKADGDETYKVEAGGRRLAALKLLVKQKKIAEDHPVNCLVLEETANTVDVIEVSLAENIVRAPVHPLDQFEAFAILKDEGLSLEDIAGRFGIAKKLVQQRLKLASVSQHLKQEYRKGFMYLEQLMAFTVTDDHALQDETWSQLAGLDPSPHTIRRHLTRSHVDGSDRRAIYVGAKAYAKAGGHIARDLFDDENQGYFADTELLDRLVTEKLEDEAKAIRKEGWGWVEVRAGNEHVDLTGYGRIRMVQQTLSDEDEAKLTQLSERYDQLVAQLEDEGNAESSKELDGVTVELEALQDKKETWPQDEKAKAGAIVSLDYTGCPQIVRGLVEPEDRRRVERATNGSGQGADTTEASNGSTKGYAESLLIDLAAQRTAALQESLARRPDVALTALLHVLVLHSFFDGYVGDCISIEPRKVFLPAAIVGSKAKLALEKRKAKWHERLPDREALWDWLTELNRKDKHDLLAYCVAVTLDASHTRSNGLGHEENSDRIAKALRFDMGEWWKPTRENFFERLTKSQIEEAVTQACSPEAARSLEGLKKPEMAAKAEKLVSGTGWLPALLETSSAVPEQRAEEAAE